MVALVIYVTWSIFIVQLRNDIFSFFFADMEQCTKPTTVWRGLYGCSSIFCPSGSVSVFFSCGLMH